jgi:hypothetical protein
LWGRKHETLQVWAGNGMSSAHFHLMNQTKIVEPDSWSGVFEDRAGPFLVVEDLRYDANKPRSPLAVVEGGRVAPLCSRPPSLFFRCRGRGLGVTNRISRDVRAVRVGIDPELSSLRLLSWVCHPAWNRAEQFCALDSLPSTVGGCFGFWKDAWNDRPPRGQRAP